MNRRPDGTLIELSSGDQYLEIRDARGNQVRRPYTRELHYQVRGSRALKFRALEFLWSTPEADRDSGQSHRQYVCETSVFGRLYGVCKDLESRIGWDEVDATFFILTGEPPKSSPMSATTWSSSSQDRKSLKVTMTIDAWVSPSTVLAAFKSVQRMALPNQVRPVSIWRLELFDEITAMIDDPERVEPDWRADTCGLECQTS